MKLTRIFARYLEQKQQRPGVFSRPFAYPYLAPLWAWIMGAFHACHVAGAFGVMARFSPRLHRQGTPVTAFKSIPFILANPPPKAGQSVFYDLASGRRSARPGQRSASFFLQQEQPIQAMLHHQTMKKFLLK